MLPRIGMVIALVMTLLVPGVARAEQHEIRRAPLRDADGRVQAGLAIFRDEDTVCWRMLLPESNTVQSAEIRAGPPDQPGAVLFQFPLEVTRHEGIRCYHRPHPLDRAYEEPCGWHVVVRYAEETLIGVACRVPDTSTLRDTPTRAPVLELLVVLAAASAGWWSSRRFWRHGRVGR